MKALLSLMAAVFLILPLQSAAQDNYLIRPGDTLRIEVLEDPTLDRNVSILPDGRFSFPFAGTILAGNRTITQVERAVASGIASNFAAEPNVFVSVVSLAQDEILPGEEEGPTIDVFFLGEVAAPGGIAVPVGTTFLQAMALNGGFTNFAALKRIQLRRTDPHTHQQTLYQIDYDALTRGAVLEGPIVLKEGDVILVPERRLFE